MHPEFEAVIGLEIHVQLDTPQKLFCRNLNETLTEIPNSRVNEISLAHPGTMPFLNISPIYEAIKMGLACGCKIAHELTFDRKHYIYPDLPKGYQLSQQYSPLCSGGSLTILHNNQPVIVHLNRIHVEEDAGKSNHEVFENFSAIDLNRAGTPLIEIVTEPCIHNPEIAYLVVQHIRKIARWLKISRGNMEEGCIRCDANVSIRKKGDSNLGTKVEIKNLNSLKFIKKALEFEIDRQIQCSLNDDVILQETRGFDEHTQTTFSQRNKEEAQDYRYFKEPDLKTLNISSQFIESVQLKLPKLPETYKTIFQKIPSLTQFDIDQLTETITYAEFFDLCLNTFENQQVLKLIANLLLGHFREFLDHNPDFNLLHINLNVLHDIIKLIDQQKIHVSKVDLNFLKALFIDNITPNDYCIQQSLFQLDNKGDINAWCKEIIQKNPEKLAAYRKGKKGLIGFFMGEVKKISQGKANPVLVNQELELLLSQS
ncbi:MAG: Asp-tRNA(Asn)/Glu-tRNA(Gln) amidotransferase subunit GatB [Alphaproteobacteria bacterium]|nr:Asp-tRNA(Asn)/Glu-tRNA(Gln) amidotransferase subunit GatB [Alphaproteobacteria bacterium]